MFSLPISSLACTLALPAGRAGAMSDKNPVVVVEAESARTLQDGNEINPLARTLWGKSQQWKSKTTVLKAI